MALFSFVGGERGTWRVERVRAVAGPGLAVVAAVDVVEGSASAGDGGWALRGATSHERYTTRAEQTLLTALSPPLGRAGSTRAALIPITKSAAWWRLAQDERRELLEGRSRHIATGLRHLPAVARRLYHGRNLGEPFDFLTWFEYAPAEAEAFEELVATLRATPEWGFVEREVDIRLTR
jgi:hypothetical protein